MVKQVPLSKGLFALVDDEDFDLVSSRSWFAVKGGKGFYACTSENGKAIAMHRFLVNPSPQNEVDHANGEGLDNRRKNLRECSHKENIRNKKKQKNTSSRFKGVSITKSGAFRAAIEQNGVHLALGTFDSEHAAARQYDRAARVLFGKFALTNEMLGLFEEVKDRVKPPSFKAEMAKLGITPRFARAS